MNQPTRQNSVTKPQEFEKDTPVLSYIFPLALYDNRGLLPTQLPDYEWSGYYRPREVVLLSTPQVEPEGWGVAIAKAGAKFASKSWRVTSKVPLRARNLQNILNNAGAGLGLTGWYQFASVAFRSYSLVGASYIEIARDRMGRITGIYHLNPLRCQLRNDDQYPVRYLKSDGTEVLMPRENIAVLSDTLDPTLGEYGLFTSAAERAFTSIVRMNSANWYTIEKVRGERPLSMSFVQGLNQQNVNDAIQTARQDGERNGLKSFMGASVIPILTDIPLAVVEIPLASLPDKFDITAERTRSDLINANALGLDPQDINPALLASGSIGTGTQALVLAEAAKGNTMAVFAKQMARFVSDLDDKCEFEFEENDYNDEAKKEDIRQKRAGTAKIYIESGLLTTNQALNMLVDEGDIPETFLAVDETDTETLTDDENAEATPNKAEGEPTQKARRPFRVTSVGRKAKRTTAEIAVDLGETGQLQQAFERVARRQFDGFPLGSALRDIGGDGLESVDRATAEFVVSQHIQPLEPTDSEERAMLAALLAAAMIGIRAKGGNMTPLELATAKAEAERMIAERISALLNGTVIDTDAPPPPDIRNPNLPASEYVGRDGEPITGLNGGGVTIIAIMLLSAIGAVKASGEPMTYTAVEREFKMLARERAKTRAEVIADTEMSRASSVGEVSAASVKTPISKTWLLTTSKTPRAIHLAQVGQTVPYNDTFPDGSFWSNELPNCKCGIEVRYQ
ncbi:MAG: hypothetical protein KDD89_06425 [Anaerolineales bacterium]|nr:hypothetical protein [Anaerolineales bacterium]